MAEAVIVDDGGSTRIKWVKDGVMGEMNSLLNVDGMQGSKHSLKKDAGEQDFTKVRIVWMDGYGIPAHEEFDLDGDVLISSQFNQNVLLKKGNNGREVEIKLVGDVIEPMVEGRRHSKKYRYVVSNSGYIRTVTINGDKVYDLEAGEVHTANGTINIGPTIVYTSVVLT